MDRRMGRNWRLPIAVALTLLVHGGLYVALRNARQLR